MKQKYQKKPRFKQPELYLQLVEALGFALNMENKVFAESLAAEHEEKGLTRSQFWWMQKIIDGDHTSVPQGHRESYRDPPPSANRVIPDMKPYPYEDADEGPRSDMRWCTDWYPIGIAADPHQSKGAFSAPLLN